MSRNKYSDSYDAMAEDFADTEKNCYTGMGGKVHYSRKSGSETYKLHVSNIPLELNEAGLVNLFCCDEFQGYNPFIGKTNDPSRPTTWGFIEFKTFREAQLAITTLHHQPPHSLNLKFAKTPEEKAAEKLNNQEKFSKDVETSSVTSNFSSMNIGRGRGVTPMSMDQDSFGRKQLGVISSRPVEEPFFGQREPSIKDYSENQFMPPNDAYEFNAANAVNSKATVSVFDNGQRRVSLGRGSYVVPNQDSPSNNSRASIPDVNDLDTILSTYISQQYKKINCQDNLRIVCNGENPLSIVFKLGQCTCCNRPSLYVCSRCKAWYCSNSCRKLDYQQHVGQCFPRSVVSFDGNGDLKLADVPDEFADATESYNNLSTHGKMSHGRNSSNYQEDPLVGQNNASSSPDKYAHQNYDSRTSLGDNKPHERNQKDSYGTNKSYDNSQQNNRYPNGNESIEFDKPSQRNSKEEPNSFRISENDSNEDKRSPRGGFKKGGSNNHGGKGKFGPQQFNRGNSQTENRGSHGGQNFRPKGGNEKTYNDSNNMEPTVRNDKRLPTPLIDHVEDGIYKRRSDLPEKFPRLPPGGNKSKAVPPIPFNQFSEVTVGAVVSDKKKFWGYPNSVYTIQAEIMSELGISSSKSDPITTKINPGLRVSAPFCGDWYRAQVKGFGPDNTIKVFFLDFGNECFVEKRDIRPLPPNIAAKPVLAQLYTLGDSPNNPKVSDEATLSLMPIKLVGDSWLVHAEGSTYSNEDTVEEVTILITDDRDHFWVRKTRDNELVEEMKYNLEEHKTIKIDPCINEIYSCWHNNSWCRAKLINKCPLIAFCIDEALTVSGLKRIDLHPLPIQYASVPQLAFKIKFAKGCANNLPQLMKGSNIQIETIKKEGDVTVCKFISSKPTSKVKGPDSSSRSQSGLSHSCHGLKEGQVCSFLIEKVMNEDFITGCIITEENLVPFKKISSLLSKKVVKNAKLKFKPGMSVAALWDNDWYRGYIMLMRGNDPVVALTDRGRVVIPQSLAPLPVLNNLPESGVRVFVKIPLQGEIMAGSICKLKITKVTNEKVIGDIENVGEAVIVPWEPTIEEAGLNVTQIKSGSKVVISSFTSPSSVYVQSAQGQDLVSRAELMQDVATHALQSEPMKRKPYSGELLAARYSDGEYYRAQIFKKQGDRFKVIFVDFGNLDWVTLDDMIPLSEGLKSIPCFALKVGLKGVPDVPFNKGCIHHLNEISINARELKMTYDTDLSQVNLNLENGDSLNLILADLLAPSWNKENFNLVESEIFMETDLEYEKWEKGSKFEIVVARVVNHNEVGVLRTDSDLLGHIESTLIPNITKYCQSHDPNGVYIPRVSEVCLAMFEEDGRWYRGLHLGQYKNNSSEIYYVDYGNTGIVPHKHIRKMVSDFMSTPVALKICKIDGVPEQLSEDSKLRLVEYFTDLKTEAIVLEVNNETRLRIPSFDKFSAFLGFSTKSSKK